MTDTLRRADFDRAADEIMARIERDGAVHKSSLVEVMVAVAATAPRAGGDVSVGDLNKLLRANDKEGRPEIANTEQEAYDIWLRQQQAGNNWQASTILDEYVQMAKQAAGARLNAAERRALESNGLHARLLAKQTTKQPANARRQESEAFGVITIGHSPVSQFCIPGRGEWYVARPLRGDRSEYLHADLEWHHSTVLGDNPTGYFQTKALAEAALQQAEQRRRSEGDN